MSKQISGIRSYYRKKKDKKSTSVPKHITTITVPHRNQLHPDTHAKKHNKQTQTQATIYKHPHIHAS